MGEKVKLDKPQLMFIDNCLSKEYILERIGYPDDY